MFNETVYMIDLRVRASDCPDEMVRYFLENQGVRVVGCCGYEDPDCDD